MMEAMEALGWGPYQADHEDANGQFEINWDFDDALKTADRVVFFKYMARSVAEKHGLRATFMPKPFQNLTGSGCHAHVSLHDAGTEGGADVPQTGRGDAAAATRTNSVEKSRGDAAAATRTNSVEEESRRRRGRDDVDYSVWRRVAATPRDADKFGRDRRAPQVPAKTSAPATARSACRTPRGTSSPASSETRPRSRLLRIRR